MDNLPPPRHHLSAPARLSLDRSRTRRRVLIALASLREGYLGQLAQVSRLRRDRVRAVLLGAPPAFAEDLSLVALGFATGSWDGRGFRFTITPRGLRHSRRVTARWRRLSSKRFALEENATTSSPQR